MSEVNTASKRGLGLKPRFMMLKFVFLTTVLYCLLLAEVTGTSARWGQVHFSPQGDHMHLLPLDGAA